MISWTNWTHTHTHILLKTVWITKMVDKCFSSMSQPKRILSCPTKSLARQRPQKKVITLQIWCTDFQDKMNNIHHQKLLLLNRPQTPMHHHPHPHERREYKVLCFSIQNSPDSKIYVSCASLTERPIIITKVNWKEKSSLSFTRAPTP